ncbi:ABC transporter permease [Propionibacterium australiense]|uniref:ABC transporter permease n=1 Tax=Propionibacterium australiense TaxID=119981 RepID=A0A383S9V2_9ACTN|nr:ABC transporter permease [Propionibacterium australiense]RLP06341.1 ABC transporter permease [Propionibacterium australiense]RLP10735.1 ABC transporter permease [Propionibacterium australiense]SYZ34511.1 ABC-2 family transporter protein [Propionibacterium australiense]VEH89824.1 ABC-2 family transporter protein [Propionibacterium australiense]
MSIFKCSLRIIAAHRGYILIYLFLLSMLGVLTGSSSGQDAVQVLDEVPTVAVIDRDGSQLSRGLGTYVESSGDPAPLDDDRRAMQDATAQNRIQYILIIPKGYEEEFCDAARQGRDAPVLDTIVSYESASGSLMDVRARAWLNQVYAYLSSGTDGPGRAVALAEEAMTREAQAELITPDSTPLPDPLVVFAKFSTYPLFAFAVVAVSTLTTALGRRPMRSRIDAAPVSGLTRSTGVLCACLVVGVVGWAWIVGLGLTVFGPENASGSAPLLGIVALALLAYVLVASAVGFLLGQLGLGENASNAVANIAGMTLSFLSGTWVPVDYMPSAVISASRFTPCYWVNQAITGAADSVSTATGSLAPPLADCGVCALFAVAVLVTGLALGRSRSSASL